VHGLPSFLSVVCGYSAHGSPSGILSNRRVALSQAWDPLCERVFFFFSLSELRIGGFAGGVKSPHPSGQRRSASRHGVSPIVHFLSQTSPLSWLPSVMKLTALLINGALPFLTVFPPPVLVADDRQAFPSRIEASLPFPHYSSRESEGTAPLFRM